ncbi:Hypothetical protein NTJ_06646 [Nesidiocoris tenuis]|uniref:Uncharacterized protein n=1 Tax=Nesidiocoris tenuis TaxID=355587 RepID=A0ABN7ANN3_9HEMI|nr:Hypothetical protein NTJ_06646 [Nesidiocoris tenuis]
MTLLKRGWVDAIKLHPAQQLHLKKVNERTCIYALGHLLQRWPVVYSPHIRTRSSVLQGLIVFYPMTPFPEQFTP